MHVYLQLSAHDHRVSRSARGNGCSCCACTGRVGLSMPLPLPSSVAVQECITHLSRHRRNESERSPDDAYVIVQVVAIKRRKESGRMYKRILLLVLVFDRKKNIPRLDVCTCGVEVDWRLGVRSSQGKTLCWLLECGGQPRNSRRVHSIGVGIEADAMTKLCRVSLLRVASVSNPASCPPDLGLFIFQHGLPEPDLIFLGELSQATA
jgi:hypothetical protein